MSKSLTDDYDASSSSKSDSREFLLISVAPQSKETPVELTSVHISNCQSYILATTSDKRLIIWTRERDESEGAEGITGLAYVSTSTDMAKSNILCCLDGRMSNDPTVLLCREVVCAFGEENAKEMHTDLIDRTHSGDGTCSGPVSSTRMIPLSA